MDRKQACLTQAATCREKAESDPANRDYWIDEAIIWLERATTPTSGVAVSYEIIDGRLVPERPSKTE
jgi:hypothetical protein